jgi:hypothetical protein
MALGLLDNLTTAQRSPQNSALLERTGPRFGWMLSAPGETPRLSQKPLQ